MQAKIAKNQSLKPYNTFGIDVVAEYFTEVHSVEELKHALKYAQEQDLTNLILGGGSNVLFTKNVSGLVIKMNLLGKDVVREDDSFFYVKAMAGENWHQFVMYCIANNYAGIENLSLIPGCCGAAPMQNIGAYGVEIKDVLYDLEALNVENGDIRVFSNEDCRFGYRESVFKRDLKNKYLILGLTLKLNKKPTYKTEYGAIQDELKIMGLEPSIKNISDAVIRIRQSKLPDPAQIGNAGSFFKNPVIEKALYDKLKQDYSDMPGYVSTDGVKVPAGWLIEKAGWKGKTLGNYGVHTKQALVLVNYGGAKGQEIYDLSTQIIGDIEKRFGIVLEREVNIY